MKTRNLLSTGAVACPRHYRYVIVGGHICLIDDSFHVSDVIHFELNL
jgi:hypothetical protein